MATVSRSLARHWLLGTLVVFSAIFGYTNSPLYGADATPTPNVSTVPKPSLFFTATPTVTPVIVIVTRAPATTVATAPNQPNQANAPATPVAPATNAPAQSGQPPAAASVNVIGAPAAVANGWTGVSTAPLPLYQLPTLTGPLLDTLPAQVTVTLLGRNPTAAWLLICCSRQQQNGWVPATALQVTLRGTHTLADLPVLAADSIVDTPTVTSTVTNTVTNPIPNSVEAPALTLQVQGTPALIWPGAVRQLQLVLTNPSTRPLTQLQVRYHLPPLVTLVNATLDQPGATVINSPTAQGVLVLMRWPQLLPGSRAVVALTLRVARDAPNGTFLDNQIDVQSSDGTTASTTFTLVLPPNDLPHFPAP